MLRPWTYVGQMQTSANLSVRISRLRFRTYVKPALAGEARLLASQISGAARMRLTRREDGEIGRRTRFRS